MLRRTLALALAGALAAGTFARPARAQDDDWSVRQNPFDPRIVNRYKALLEKNPSDKQALKKLVELYARYSTVEKLTEEYEAKLAKKPDNFAFAMILGHLFRHRGEVAKAVGYYERAAAIDPSSFAVHVALAELYRQQQRPADAIAAYEQALSRARAIKDKKAILRALGDLALDHKDIARAQSYYQQYFELDPSDISARLDLADALARHGLHAEALAAYQDAEKRLRTDPARRVEVLARIGREHEALGKEDDAIATYRQAMELTQKGHHLRKELTERIIDIYRKRQDLRTLVAYYEKVWPAGGRGHFEWDVMARLYEETGEQDKALDAYRAAVRAAPYELDTQRRLISLLERAGRDDEVIKQYEAVIRVAPGDPRFQLELAERYFKRGHRKQALELAKRIAGRFPDDAGVHAALADLYSRWGEEALALKEYEILARIEPDDESHLVNLGEQYFQRGDKAKAIETWKRIIASKTPESYARLAEIYAEHDMGVEAIDMYQKAIALKPKEPAFWRGLAGVHERQRQDDRAIEAWTKVLELTENVPAQKPMRREARSRIISILYRGQRHRFDARTREWEQKFAARPPDLEAGYFLAEARVKQGRYGDAETVLKRILEHTPDDLDAMHQLVSVYKSLRKYQQAIELYKLLAEKEPSRAREYYQEISSLNFTLNQDDEAIAYAQKALEQSPNDAKAQEQLAEIFEKKEDYEKAIEAYQRAVALSPRNFKVHFQLARLYIRLGRREDAAKIYREVIRRASDEETIRSAARKAIDLEEYMGTLGALEAELAPLAFTFTQKPIYRRILVEVFERYVPPLVARARRGDAEAKKELTRLGEHGLKPLLEALADRSDPQQQRIAVRVLGYLGNRNAAVPLVKVALDAPETTAGAAPTPPGTPRQADPGDGPDMEMRVEAIVAAGRLGDPRIVPQLVQLAKHREVTLREAAVWALGRTGDPKAVPALVAALDDSRGSVQALACLGLGRIGDKRSLAPVAALMKKTGASGEARAACAYALGLARADAYVPDLIAIVSEGNDDVQRKAAWALGRIGDKRAVAPLLRAYFTKKERLREAIVWALVELGGGAAGATAGRSSAPEELDVTLEAGRVDYRRLVRGLAGDLGLAPLDPGLVRGHADEIAAGLHDALGRHYDLKVRVLRDLDAREAGLGLGPLTAGLDGASAPDRAALQPVLDGIAAKIAPEIEQLTEDPDAEIRRLAVSVLAKTRQRSAPARVTRALADPELRVRLGAMGAAERYVALVGPRSTDAAPLAAAVAGRLGAESWRERVAAAETLGRLGEAAATAPLVKALADADPFVREAAARALGQLKRVDALEALLATTSDEVPEVRLAAVRALVGLGDPRARSRLGELAASDPDARVRAAAGNF